MSFMGKIDGNTQYAGGAEELERTIDHAASAKENLRQAGRHLQEMLTPDKIRQAAQMFEVGSDSVLFGFGIAFGTMMMPFMAALDALDLVVQPFAALKDAADAAVHGVIAGFKKLVG
ncbi:MAG: hypothetical protein KatS3mg102_0382 [Planctomycetota bacterium]|nr:MAG: hypothetical protein KatS3mg102_0382 [Planctomycetota bacterium]